MDTPAQVPDYYVDQFNMAIGPYGCALIFGLMRPGPPSEGGPRQVPVATVRMSLEHLKAMAYVIHRQVTKYQSEFNVQVHIPEKALESLNTTKDEWRRFWGEP